MDEDEEKKETLEDQVRKIASEMFDESEDWLEPKKRSGLNKRGGHFRRDQKANHGPTSDSENNKAKSEKKKGWKKKRKSLDISNIKKGLMSPADSKERKQSIIQLAPEMKDPLASVNSQTMLHKKSEKSQTIDGESDKMGVTTSSHTKMVKDYKSSNLSFETESIGLSNENTEFQSQTQDVWIDSMTEGKQPRLVSLEWKQTEYSDNQEFSNQRLLEPNDAKENVSVNKTGTPEKQGKNNSILINTKRKKDCLKGHCTEMDFDSLVNEWFSELQQQLYAKNRKFDLAVPVVYDRIKQVIQGTFNDDLVDLYIYGSSATGLMIPSSDVDICVSASLEIEKDQALLFLDNICDNLRLFKWVQNLKFIKGASLPVIKLVIARLQDC
jgi:hypothetical protein